MRVSIVSIYVNVAFTDCFINKVFLLYNVYDLLSVDLTLFLLH